MIHVIAVIIAKPGQREALLQAFRDNLAAVLAEPGCIEYGATVDIDDGPRLQAKYGVDTVVVVEKWETLDALMVHGAAPHMVSFSARTRELVASRQIHILTPV